MEITSKECFDALMESEYRDRLALVTKKMSNTLLNGDNIPRSLVSEFDEYIDLHNFVDEGE